ncbi:MAG: NAD-dependent epimerase/dehydratase family protein [Candidatus Binataceae bacterium]|nr:NAD-dependent epimerase/dehydratase family protein [Candidatus Binataceae bacterium]
MGRKVLIVGGAGFIGSHLADELLEQGHRVRILDNLDLQVHGDDATRPDYLDSEAELTVADVRDAIAVERALHGVEVVYHLAAAVGVGQSMYEISRYSSVNCLGTAVLLEAIIRNPVERLIVASSMSVYGEGSYRNSDGHIVAQARRDVLRLTDHEWELTDDVGRQLTPMPTSEAKAPEPSSVYALLKYNQERTCLCVGEAYKIPTVALRFFNAFGSRQALSNPYTGVMAIFAARLLNGESPLIYEDGGQLRDFVSVRDVSRACRLAMESERAIGQVFNVGSGSACAVLELAERMASVLGRSNIKAQVTRKYRVGDIRHCFADISRAQNILGFQPKVSLEQGLVELAEWLAGQVALDRVAQAGAELAHRGLAL